jgi:hypothetical protein
MANKDRSGREEKKKPVKSLKEKRDNKKERKTGRSSTSWPTITETNE